MDVLYHKLQANAEMILRIQRLLNETFCVLFFDFMVLDKR
jgi:hypothetical protein